MSGGIHMSRLRSRWGSLRVWLARQSLAYFYGLFAVLVVASVGLFFSLEKGGYFTEQWYWGVAAIAVALVGATLVPGYLSSPSVGYKQWALAGMLLLFVLIVAASISWSISPHLSILEASRTAMYSGVFVLLLPAVARWGSLVVDATIFGVLLPPALYGLLQKILPTSMEYTGFVKLEADSGVSSTVGYHPTFGMMCAMGALLVVARVGSFRSALLRAIYSATGVLFLVALYFSFSRGGLWALVVGAVVLLALAKHRFEVLVNMAIIALPALWVVSHARGYSGLVTRPVSLTVMQTDGLVLPKMLLGVILLALAAQVLFTGFIWAFARFVPERTRGALRIADTVVVVGAIACSLFLGWSTLQQAGGFDELASQSMTAYSAMQAEVNKTDRTERLSSLGVADRVVVWKIAWQNWREHPLTGTGGDTYQVVYEKKASENGLKKGFLHPHSIWMSLLSDTGIFAFLAFAAFCVGCLVLACYNAFSKTVGYRSRALLAGSAAAVAGYLVSSSIDWNWYIPASTLPFFTLAAVAVGTRARSNSTWDSPSTSGVARHKSVSSRA